MSEVNVHNSCGGVGFVGLLTLVFISFKLAGIVDWSWLWVLSPIWISFLIWLFVASIFLLVIGILIVKDANRKKYGRKNSSS